MKVRFKKYILFEEIMEGSLLNEWELEFESEKELSDYMESQQYIGCKVVVVYETINN